MYSALLLKPKERVDALNVLAVPLLFLGEMAHLDRQGSWEQ